MNIKLKRITASLLACAVTGMLIPENGALYADAAEIISSGECGDNASWTLDSEGLLTISGTGAIADTMFGETPWDSAAVKKAVIKPGITSIERTAFNGNANMTEIIIPDTVTEIGLFAFINCNSLTEINIPYSVTEIGDCAFSMCDALKEINVESTNRYYADEDGILFTKDMAELLCYPQNRTNSIYSIPTTVKTIGNSSFGDCENLTSVSIPNGVKYIKESAFSGCSGIRKMYLPESVAEIEEYAFCDCTSLTSIFFFNPDCIIADYSYTICNTSEFVSDDIIKRNGYFSGHINGLDGSTAQAYADKYNYTFARIIPITTSIGDVNLDGAVDALDASQVLTEYASVSTGKPSVLDNIEKRAADTDLDGNINALDASYILSYYAYKATGGTGTFEEYMK